MALVFTASRRGVEGDRKYVMGTVSFTGSSSYATGGIAFQASDFGLVNLDHMDIYGSNPNSVYVNHNTSKFIIAGTHPSASEMANAGDPTGVTIKVKAIGY